MFTLTVRIDVDHGDSYQVNRRVSEAEAIHAYSILGRPQTVAQTLMNHYYNLCRQLLDMEAIKVVRRAQQQQRQVQPKTPTHDESTTTGPTAPSTPPAAPLEEPGLPTTSYD